MTTAPRPDLPESRKVGDYTLLTRIGEGGMGVVHLARRPGGERVALKVLRPHIVGDDEARARLAREVGSLRRIRSRWVAEIVDADPWAPVPYVATRYVPGLSLHDHVLEEGAITGPDLDWFAGCLAEGVASVHGVGVLHRDIKPSNVLMEGRTPILIDFGLARVADDPKLTHTGWLLGTPGYLAPEILYGDDATAASDVHSWAATVAYAGTGRAPFGRGPSMAIMDRVRRGEHDLSGLPDRLRVLLAAALDPEPDSRPDLDELLARLRPGDDRHTVARPTERRPAQSPFTVPLAAVSSAAAADVTDRFAPDPTRVDDDPTLVEPEWSGAGSDSAPERADDAPWPAAPWDEPAPEPRVGWAERARRAALLCGAAVTTGAALAAYPVLAAVVLVLLTWLLRSGSMAASAAGDRRRLRGRRWYDGVQLLLAAPWHLLRSIGGTVLLVLWSAGLAAAGALLCYAVAASPTTTLFVSGLVLGVSLWMGPGGSRVRSPLARLVHPLAASLQGWVAGLLLVVAVAALLGLRVQADGTSWTPAPDRPWSGLHLPDRLPLGPASGPARDLTLDPAGR